MYWNWGWGLELELELVCKFVQFCRPLANHFKLANEVWKTGHASVVIVQWLYGWMVTAWGDERSR